MCPTLLPAALLSIRAVTDRLRRAVAADVGEGVISAAIAVLVMAFLGLAMWVAFSEIFQSSADTISTQVEKIGS